MRARGAACAIAIAWAACVRAAPGGDREEVGAQDCYGCHRLEYLEATEPVHVDNNPTSCWECHATAAWQPALEGGDHPEEDFPIAEGPHEDIACIDCHVPELGPSEAGDNVSCIGCHTGEHDRDEMDDKHDEVDDYVWDEPRPTFCRDCHPRGRE